MARYPKPFTDFMLSKWAPAKPPKASRHAMAAACRKRRNALSRKFPRDVLVVPSGGEKTRANDTEYRFRPGTDFFYLTANPEPDSVLVMLPKRSGHEHVLFVHPNHGRDTIDFFASRKGALWEGDKLGTSGSLRVYGVHRCESLEELPAFLKKIRKRKTRVLRGP